MKMYAIVVDTGRCCWWQMFYSNGKITAIGPECTTKSNAKRSLRNFSNNVGVRLEKAIIRTNWPKDQFIVRNGEGISASK